MMKQKGNFLAILFFSILTIAFFWQVIFLGQVPLPTDLAHDYLLDESRQGSNPLIRDSVVQMYPNIDFIFQSYKNLEFPKENSYIFNGINNLATGQSTVFSPFNLFIIFFSSSLSFFSFLVIIYFFLSGFNFFIFLRGLKYKTSLSLLGGLIWQLSGPLIMWQSWATIVGVICWLPLILLGLQKFFNTQKVNWLLLFTLANFLSLTSGHLQFYIYILCFSLIYGFYLFIRKRPQKIIPLILFITLNILLVALITWPFISNISDAHRSQISDSNHLSYQHLIQFALPNFWGDHNSYKASLNYVETSSYIGLIPLILIITGIFYFKKDFFRKNIFWLACLGGLIIYNFAPIILKPIYLLFPFLNSFPPFRSLFLINFILIILAIKVLAQLKVKNLFIAILIIIALVDQSLSFYNFNPKQSREPLESPPAYVSFLQQQEINKPLVYSEVCPLNLYSVYNIRSIFGYDTTYSEEYYQLIKDHGKIKSHRNILNAKIKDTDFLKELGVNYIITKQKKDLEQVFYQDNIYIYKLTY